MNLKELVIKEAKLNNIEGFNPEQMTLPPTTEQGDYSLPCFIFAKTLKKAPAVIAGEFAEKIKTGSIIERVEAVNGYLNFFIDRNKASFNILSEILTEGENFGKSEMGRGKTVCIDYSSVNLAKYMHIGHLSTTSIGECLKRAYKFLGYKTVGINYIGDYGTPFGKMITGYKLWGNEKDVLARGVDAIQDLYIKFCAEAEKDNSLNDLARDWFKKIEQNDKEASEIYGLFIKLAIEDIEKIYSLLNIEFDSWRGESFYNNKMQPIIDELANKKLLQESQGAKIVDLEKFNLGVCLIQKSDGSSLYATRDLAAADDRYINYNFDKSLYVTDVSQKQHFAQFFKVLELLNRPYAKNLEHVYYGRFSLPEGKIASRKGKQAILKDIFAGAIEKATTVMKERGTASIDEKKVATDIGVGAVVFSALKNEKIKDVVFDIDAALNFDGETSPYIQYTHARCCSIIEKAGNADSKALIADYNYSQINNIEAYDLLKLLNSFPDTVFSVIEKKEPCFISRLLIDICKAYNKYYNSNRIIDGDKINLTRLALTKTTKIVLKIGLEILNIVAVEKM